MRFHSTLVLVMLFFSVSAEANCLANARSPENQQQTAYERIYCEIVERGEGKRLPRFEDFKKNDVMVQRLLLKRPAQKLKIALPSPSKAKAKKGANQTSVLDKPARLKQTNKANEVASVVSSNVSLSRCTLGKNLITCGQRRFGLIRNEPNGRLANGVLGDQHLMALPPFRGDAENGREVQFYLSEVYGHYIQRMIDIGLGASTMSYARFYHTFYDLKVKSVDFSERFETMYRFLKKDKKTMAVKTLPSHKRPHSLSQCDDITEKMIVCDIGSVNWVYMN
ncbi:hypothetical protein [Alkalimarinus alittae]|uniref:Uncharacterized protein n=1 Tax=Alkalimarinus alittae TaxID=2961619 RepID=A0ABY6MZM3_9ALTE|nr:hypothetical protein [Alkalimarinus alittae]UZE95296.1 hypothetical protein NKI27_14665 [Alkalimarinus alittae]